MNIKLITYIVSFIFCCAPITLYAQATIPTTESQEEDDEGAIIIPSSGTPAVGATAAGGISPATALTIGVIGVALMVIGGNSDSTTTVVTPPTPPTGGGGSTTTTN
mgnify:CR=1 FL=1